MNLKNILEKNKYLAFILFILQLPLFFKSFQKILTNKDFSFIDLNSILLSMCLFIFILFTAKGLVYLFKLNINYSFSYVLFFLASFAVANLLAVTNVEIEFFYFYFCILLVSNIAFFKYEENFILKILHAGVFAVISFVNFNKSYLSRFVYNRSEQSGDVDLLILPNIEKIYNSNILEVFKNPVADAGFFHINFTIFGNFYFATLAKTLSMVGDFLTVNLLPYTLFFLFIIFVYELKIDSIFKILLLTFHLNILIINPWIRYLLNNSYMTEGISSLFFVVIFYNLLNKNVSHRVELNFLYFFVGFFIFSKLFISLFIFIYLIFMKKWTIQQITLLSIGPLTISYLMFIKYPPSNTNELLNGFNAIIIQDIIKYWLEDSIWIYSVFCCFLILFTQLAVFKKINIFNRYVLFFNVLNLFLIFTLYSLSWTEGVEFESSYRYMLQNYFLNLIFTVTLLGNENKI